MCETPSLQTASHHVFFPACRNKLATASCSDCPPTLPACRWMTKSWPLHASDAALHVNVLEHELFRLQQVFCRRQAICYGIAENPPPSAPARSVSNAMKMDCAGAPPATSSRSPRRSSSARRRLMKWRTSWATRCAKSGGSDAQVLSATRQYLSIKTIRYVTRYRRTGKRKPSPSS